MSQVVHLEAYKLAAGKSRGVHLAQFKPNGNGGGVELQGCPHLGDSGLPRRPAGKRDGNVTQQAGPLPGGRSDGDDGGMGSESLTDAQRDALVAQLRRHLTYLNKLTEKMLKKNCPLEDPVRDKGIEAKKAMQRLYDAARLSGAEG